MNFHIKSSRVYTTENVFSHSITGSGWLEVCCHGDRQDLPVGFCPGVHPGNSWPLSSASFTWGGHLTQFDKKLRLQFVELHCLYITTAISPWFRETQPKAKRKTLLCLVKVNVSCSLSPFCNYIFAEMVYKGLMACAVHHIPVQESTNSCPVIINTDLWCQLNNMMQHDFMFL